MRIILIIWGSCIGLLISFYEILLHRFDIKKWYQDKIKKLREKEKKINENLKNKLDKIDEKLKKDLEKLKNHK